MMHTALKTRLLTACLLWVGIAPLAMAAEETATPASAANGASSPAKAATSMTVVFIEADLRGPGAANPGSVDSDLVDWHVADMGQLLRERASIVLAANGLSGSCLVVPAPKPGEALDISAAPAGSPLLVLRVDKISKWKPAPFTRAGRVTMEARLMDDTASIDKPRWSELLGGNQLGFDPVFGVLKTNRVDATWIDSFLTFALERLAKAGQVKLSGPKAVAP